MSRALRTTALFYALACALSWGVVGLFLATGGNPKTPMFLVMSLAFMVMPAVAAFVVQHKVLREDIPGPLGMLGLPNRWFLGAWFAPIGIALLAMLATALMPGIRLSFDAVANIEKFAGQLTPEQLAEAKKAVSEVNPLLLFMGQFVGALFAGATVNAVVALGEELGWRGLLQRELAPLGFWRSSLVIGLLWGLWHAPLIALGHNYPEHPLIGIAMMVGFCGLVSPIISYFRLRTKSVVAAAIFHGSLNASAGFALLYTIGGNDLTKGLTGLPGFVVLVLINVFLAVRGVKPAQDELAAIAPPAALPGLVGRD